MHGAPRKSPRTIYDVRPDLRPFSRPFLRGPHGCIVVGAWVSAAVPASAGEAAVLVLLVGNASARHPLLALLVVCVSPAPGEAHAQVLIAAFAAYDGMRAEAAMRRLGLLAFLLAASAAMTARADRVPMGFGSDIDAGEVATRLNAGSCRAFLASHPTHALPEIAGIGFVGGFICVEHEQQLFYRYDGDRRAYRAAAILDAGDVAGAARAEADLTQAIQHHIEKTEAEWAPFIPRAQFGSRPCSSLSAADIQRGSGWGSIGPALALACSGPAHAYIYIATEDGFARRAILPLRSGNEELRARAVALVQEEAQRRPGILTVPARPSHRASTPAVDENPAPEAVERSHVSSQSRLFWLLIAFAVIVAIVVLVVFRWLFQSWEQDKRRRAADEAMRRMEELRRLEVERERLRQQPITDAAEQLRRMQQQMQDEIERIKRTLGGNTP